MSKRSRKQPLPDVAPSEQKLPRNDVISYKNRTQREYAKLIAANSLVFSVGPAGSGKAQPLDAKVFTPLGFVPMGDVKIGQSVIAASGETAEVIGVYPQGEKEIYRITFEDGAVTEACGEHLWSIYSDKFDEPCDRQSGRLRVLTTDILRLLLSISGLKKRLYVPLPKPMESERLDYMIDPYLLGVLIGDGHLGRSVGITTTDDEIIGAAAASIVENGYELRQSKGNDISYFIRAKDSVEVMAGYSVGGQYKNVYLKELKNLGLLGMKSYEKFIPDLYLTGSIEQRFQLLQGLFDTDGTVDPGGHITFSTTSEVLARQVQWLVRSLGGLCKKAERRTKYV